MTDITFRDEFIQVANGLRMATRWISSTDLHTTYELYTSVRLDNEELNVRADCARKILGRMGRRVTVLPAKRGTWPRVIVSRRVMKQAA